MKFIPKQSFTPMLSPAGHVTEQQRAEERTKFEAQLKPECVLPKICHIDSGAENEETLSYWMSNLYANYFLLPPLAIEEIDDSHRFLYL